MGLWFRFPNHSSRITRSSLTKQYGDNVDTLLTADFFEASVGGVTEFGATVGSSSYGATVTAHVTRLAAFSGSSTYNATTAAKPIKVSSYVASSASSATLGVYAQGFTITRFPRAFFVHHRQPWVVLVDAQANFNKQRKNFVLAPSVTPFFYRGERHGN